MRRTRPQIELTCCSHMRIMFVTWWPEGHFEYRWHLNDDEVAKLAERGVEVTHLAGDCFHAPASASRLLRRAKLLWRVLRLSRTSDVVIGYMDSPSTRAISICRRLGLMRHPMFVITDFWLSIPDRGGMRQFLKRMFLRHVHGSADMVLFDSEPGMLKYRELGLLGPRPRIDYLPSSAMRGKLDYLTSLVASLPARATSDKPYLFAIGKSFRDFNTVLEAAVALPDVDFVVMTRVTLEGLPPNVRQAPWGSYEEYIDIVRGSSALIIPLKAGYEAAGLRSLFEAFALKVPAIVASSGGITRYLSDGGELAVAYRPGEASSLVESVRMVFERPEEVAVMAERAYLAATQGEHSSAAYLSRLWRLLQVGLESNAGRLKRIALVDSFKAAD